MTTYTTQGLQANITSILNKMDAGTLGSVEVIKAADGATVAKLVPYATYAAADIANTSVVELIPQTLAASGPMNPASNGLYKTTKAQADAVSTPDNTTHATLQFTDGPGGILFTAKRGGVYGNSIRVALVNPGAPTATTTVAVVAKDITVTMKYAGGVVTATMNEIAAAVNAHAAASALVTATVTGVGTTTAGPDKASLAYATPAVKAFQLYSAGGGNGIAFVAKTAGVAGNSITVRLHDPGVVTASCSSATVGTAITVTLKNSTGAAIDATLSNIVSAIALDAAATALITATVYGAGGTTAVAQEVATALAGGAAAAAGNQTYTADTAGTAGNSIRVRFVDPGVVTAATSAAAVGNDITVTLKNTTGAVVDATVANVKTAMDAAGGVAALVDVATVSGGTAYVAAMAYTSLTGGTAGTLGLTSLSGGAIQAAGAQKFRAYGIYRVRQHSRIPALRPR